MPINTFESYWQAMTVIDAQRLLREYSVADYPNVKLGTKRKLHRQVHKMAYPATWDRGARVSLDQFFGKPMVKSDGE